MRASTGASPDRSPSATATCSRPAGDSSKPCNSKTAQGVGSRQDAIQRAVGAASVDCFVLPCILLASPWPGPEEPERDNDIPPAEPARSAGLRARSGQAPGTRKIPRIPAGRPPPEHRTIDPLVLQSAFGILAILTLARVTSRARSGFPWRVAAGALALQFALALALLKLPAFRAVSLAFTEALGAVERATQTGTSFVFGYLGGGSAPFAVTDPPSTFVLAFRALPIVLVVSALSSLLFHWRVLPWIVRLVSRLLQRTLGIGGAVGLSAAADVFVGMVEAPLFIRPYLAAMSRGELFSVMTCGMATIAGTVMALYASLLSGIVPDAMGHILTASLVATPGAILIAELMVPAGATATAGELTPSAKTRSAMDAVTQGTLAGVELLIHIVAMLVVFVALASLANLLLGLLPQVAGAPLTLQRMLGWLMAPAAWLVGIPWSEATVAGALMGTKTVLNELIAYVDLARLPADALSERSRLLMTYALCGFANLGSLGILIGGLGAMAPGRRDEIIALGPRAVVSGTLSTMLAAAVVGVLTPS